MTRPDDIPANLWEAVWRAFWGGAAADMVEPSIVNAARLKRIARAMMAVQLAERERHKLLTDALESIAEHAPPHYGANAARQALTAFRNHPTAPRNAE